jgi:hypothetical protein
MYIFLLRHIHLGTQNKWLITVVGILIAYNIALIGWGAMATRLFVKGHRSAIDVDLFGFFVGMSAATFNVSHYMIAEKYQTIAKKVPTKLRGLPDPPVTKCEVVTDWSLLVINLLGGVMYGVTNIGYLQTALIHGNPPGTWAPLRVSSLWLTRICALISGVILVKAIFDIKKFFEEKKAVSFIDTKMMLRHSAAFGLFLLFETLMATCGVINEIYKNGPIALRIFRIVILLDVIAQFIS